MSRANEFTYWLSKALAYGGNTGFDAGFDSSLFAAVTTDTTQTITVSTQTLTGELTGMNLVVTTYGSLADPDAVSSNINDQYPFGMSYLELTITGLNFSGANRTLSRAIIRDSSGHMRYIFDLPSPMIVQQTVNFRINFRHNFAGT